MRGAVGLTIVVERKGSEVFPKSRSVGVVALRVHAASGPVQVGSLADAPELVCLRRAKVLALTTCPLTGKDVACVIAIDSFPKTSDPRIHLTLSLLEALFQVLLDHGEVVCCEICY